MTRQNKKLRYILQGAAEITDISEGHCSVGGYGGGGRRVGGDRMPFSVAIMN